MLVSKTPLILMHLIGLCLSIGPVLLIDCRFVRVLMGAPVIQEDVDLILLLSGWIRIGLALLWISGAGLLVFYAAHTPEALDNPKLHAKLVVVALLTLNGVLVERYLFGQLRARAGRGLFAPGDTRQHLAILAIGAVSATSWYTPFVLGTTRELNFACPAWMILGSYAIAVVGAFGGLWVVTRPARPEGALTLDILANAAAAERRPGQVEAGGVLS